MTVVTGAEESILLGTITDEQLEKINEKTLCAVVRNGVQELGKVLRLLALRINSSI